MKNAANADHLSHAFSTFLGLPPDIHTPPACGATLTPNYNGAGLPRCPKCAALVAAHQAPRR